MNPWIYLAFNANLFESLRRIFCPMVRRHDERRGAKALRQQHKKHCILLRERNHLNTSREDRVNKSRSISPALTHRYVF